ncbi:restriction endonuclease [Proteus mirabilis]|nr:restriction endonuclease [Proteus mirabilis]
MAKFKFKSIYFPASKVKSGISTRINISIPIASAQHTWSESFLSFINGLSGPEIRELLGNPILDDLEDQANQEHRSLSNLIITLLEERYDPLLNSLYCENNNYNSKDKHKNIGVTFSDSLRKGLYGWYPYVEGFSANYARDAILRNKNNIRNVYDPFGGSGTTQLAAAQLGLDAFYSELNPFMNEVTISKIVSSAWIKNNFSVSDKIFDAFLNEINSDDFKIKSNEVKLLDYYQAFPNRNFFEEQHIKEILYALNVGKYLSNGYEHIERVIKVACIANAISCSNMTRRADLRRRRPDEYKNRIVNVPLAISSSLKRMREDIVNMSFNNPSLTLVNDDARKLPEKYHNYFDFVLTSPPYLNGTNYFRNTKIELWLYSFISNEKELRAYRDKTVTGGINDVSKNPNYHKFDSVEKIASLLDVSATDKRIPTMVRHYFSDMYEVLVNIYNGLVNGGDLLLDIGDSKFYGVHVPTNSLLIDVAESIGFKTISENVLAQRLSRDKTKLIQVEILLRK